MSSGVRSERPSGTFMCRRLAKTEFCRQRRFLTLNIAWKTWQGKSVLCRGTKRVGTAPSSWTNNFGALAEIFSFPLPRGFQPTKNIDHAATAHRMHQQWTNNPGDREIANKYSYRLVAAIIIKHYSFIAFCCIVRALKKQKVYANISARYVKFYIFVVTN